MGGFEGVRKLDQKSNAKYSAASSKIKGRKTNAFAINPGPKGALKKLAKATNRLTARKSVVRTKAATNASSTMDKNTGKSKCCIHRTQNSKKSTTEKSAAKSTAEMENLKIVQKC